MVSDPNAASMLPLVGDGGSHSILVWIPVNLVVLTVFRMRTCVHEGAYEGNDDTKHNFHE